MISHPFDSPRRFPGSHLRGPDGVLTAADEVAFLRRQNIQDYLNRHEVFDATVDDVLARAAEAGEDVALAEARAGRLRHAD